MMKRGLVLAVVFVFFLSVSFASASPFTNVSDKITGHTVSDEGWTDWLNSDNPFGSGDYELIENLRYGGFTICEGGSILDIQCQTVDGVDFMSTGQNVTCSKDYGFSCVNTHNDERCMDYRVRFLCGVLNEASMDGGKNETLCDGCLGPEDACFMINATFNGQVCSSGKTWIDQKIEGSPCVESFECVSGVCSDEGICKKPNFIQRFINTLKRWFT